MRKDRRKCSQTDGKCLHLDLAWILYGNTRVSPEIRLNISAEFGRIKTKRQLPDKDGRNYNNILIKNEKSISFDLANIRMKKIHPFLDYQLIFSEIGPI